MKWISSWQVFLAMALPWAVLAHVAGPSWFGMLDAAMVGYCLGAGMWMWHCNRWRTLFEQTRDALETMTDINDALIHNRVTLHFLGETAPPDLPDEHKPRLH